MSDQEISNLSKSQFKKIVCDRVNEYAFSSLIETGKGHSKSVEIIESLKKKYLYTQPYLLTTQLTTSQRQLLFSTRTKMYDVKSNFRQKYSHNMSCRSCKLDNTYEDIRHLISCEALKININPKSQGISVEDMYGGLESQIKFVKFFEKIHTKRQILQDLDKNQEVPS